MASKLQQILRIFVVAALVAVAFNFSFSGFSGAADKTLVPVAQAASQELNLWGDFFNPAVGTEAFDKIGLGRKDPRVIAANVIKIAFGLLGTLAVILMMYGGWLWMTSGGDPDKIKTASAVLRNAAIGLLIILSAFAIAVYVLSRLIFATSGQKVPWGGGGAGGGSALGALGAGIIKSVYPAPEARDVPRNTAIIVSFREAIDPASICAPLAGGHCAPGAKLLPASVRFYKAAQGDDESTNLTEVLVASTDNRTFVFSPLNYLGSPSEKVWYAVALTPEIKKANGSSAFSLGGFQWKFEISERLDLTPPQVLDGGIFPAPDASRDSVGSVVDAKQAVGFIVVKGTPRAAQAVSVSVVKTNPASVDLEAAEPSKNNCDGQLEIAINNTNPLSANLTYRNIVGKVNSPQTPIVDRKVATACGFSVEFTLGYQAGMSWRLTLASARAADYLMVGAARYNFVAAAASGGEIRVDPDLNILATNIKNALAASAQVSAAVAGANITLTAAAAGRAGNEIILASSAAADVLALSPLAGGADRAEIIKVEDKPDKPKNAVIQINFNEAINPLVASGPASAVSNYLRVINLADNSLVAGEWRISNQFQTVEFIPSTQCGLNGCGEKIYCLPPASQLRVELTAAALAATCTSDNDCLARTPYNTCRAGVCTNKTDGAAYPAGQIASGIMDLANNSLDGNRDGRASGPLSFYDANAPLATAGDSFRWSFWISDQLDLAPPQIVSTAAATKASGVSLTNEVKIYFNKLMLADSLSSGSVQVNNGQETITHKLINLWSVSKEALGYWVEKVNQETSAPPDNEPDQTVVLIKHETFKQSTLYRAQVGSGVKDIYQNCFKPCSGAGCQADAVNACCCDGAASPLGPDGNCP